MMHNCGCGSSKVAWWLVFIGGLNWGLVGISMLLGKGMSWNLVSMLLGKWPTVEAVVYLVVGIAAVMSLVGCKCKTCQSCTAGATPAA